MWRSLKQNKSKIVGGLSGLLMALLLIFAWPLVLIFSSNYWGFLRGSL